MARIGKGDAVLVHKDRPELAEYYPSFVGKTGTVVAVQDGTGDLLLKFKRQSQPVAFPLDHVTAGLDQ